MSTRTLFRKSARDLIEAFAREDGSPSDAVAACRERIQLREPSVHAWRSLYWDAVDAQLAERAKTPGPERGPLWGVPIGVKDIFDTMDTPTAYGSEIYDGHRPAADAACVARLRAAGAIILGKTVTTEFAWRRQGPTRHPRDAERSPGGSSSGSAAAVADGMVPLALGSQTAASVIRPAAYCGIVGFKPTHGLISLQGVKGFAASLDTAGAFARTVGDVALLVGVMAGRPAWADAKPAEGSYALRVWTGPEMEKVAPAAATAFEAALEKAREGGGAVDRPDLPDGFAELAEAQDVVMHFEAAREQAHERRVAFDRLSAHQQELLTKGEAISPQDYDQAVALRDACLAKLDALFGEADALVTPSAVDVAPLYKDGTGDPALCRAFTMLGLPSITLPCGSGDGELPFGLQLVARPGRDLDLLGLAARLESQGFVVSAPE